MQNICTWITFTWCFSINALICSVMICEISSSSFIGASIDSLCVCFTRERSGNIYHSMKCISPLGCCIDVIMKTWTLQLQHNKLSFLFHLKKPIWQVKALIICSINAQTLKAKTCCGLTVKFSLPFDQFWSLLTFHLLFLIKKIKTCS